jgi:hypothetical protein
MNTTTQKRRMEVRCLCGNWGRLTWTGVKKEGKDVCTFVCSCSSPHVDFDNPW